MKNKFLLVLSCAILLLASITAKAVPAYPGLIDFKQPNGQIVKIYIHGDEFLHWASTEDGYTLLYDAEGYLTYAEKETVTGKLVPSKMRPSSPDASGRRRAPERNFLEGIEKGLWFSDEQVSMARQAVNAFNQGIKKSPAKARWKEPVTGEKRFVMLLVEFQDVHFTHTKKEFEKLMNQLNYHEDGHFGSVRDFYRENSFGKLDLITDVFGVYRVSRDMAYYGGASDYDIDNNPFAMFTEAVTLADSEIDFSRYDNDGDGIVDGIHLIYAGFGEEAGGGEDCIWAHSMSFSWSAQFDGKSFNRYSCSSELRGFGGASITYIGVICHEIGHVLGTLDFYDTNYNYGGSYPGNGYYDLMSSGSWNGGGVCPAHFNPYSKIYDFRWAEPMDGNSAQTLTLNAKDENGFVRIDTKTPNEYYLLEYRSKTGFDSALPGHGLVIYHAAEDLEEYTKNWWNSLNSTHRQRFYIVSANAPEAIPTKNSSSYGILNNTAPFPGRNGVVEFTDFTVPSMRSWNGATTDFPITSIEEDIENETISFDIAGGKDGGASGLRVANSDLNSITLTWKKQENQKVLLVYSKTNGTGNPENNKDYAVGETIADCGEVIYFGTGNGFLHTALDEAETYYYRLYTLKDDGSWTSARTTAGKTQVGVIRKFPFTEDFEDGKLGENWKAESVVRNYMVWNVSTTNFEDRKLQARFFIDSSGSNFPHRKEVSRLILPTIDFTGHKNALLSFDYSNFMEEFAVEYKASPSDSWHRVKTYGTMMNDDVEGSTDEKKILNSTERVFISLPQVSSTYELSFLATYKGNNGSIRLELENITIDNIKIETDFDMLLVTEKPIKVSNSSASISAECIEGLVKMIANGVEWSLDNNEWNKVEAHDGVAELNALPNGAVIYYRAYAVGTDDNIRYGETKEFKTTSFSKGDGTETNPFVIEDETEWENFVDAINEGNKCSGLHFALGSSFTIYHSLFATKDFCGTLDGQDFTIAIDTTTVDTTTVVYKSLLNRVGKSGCVKNLKILTKNLTYDAWQSSGITMKNDGIIINCSFAAENEVSSPDFSGICSLNNGWIVNCHADFVAECLGIGGGISGICRNNYGTITNCTSSGTYKAPKNNTMSGIVSYNSTKILPNGNKTNGLISNCINYADFYNAPSETKSGTGIGGICCSSQQGRIEICINYGNIYADHYSHGYYYYGSILAHGSEEGTDIYDCVNYGKIALNCSNNAIPNEYRPAGVIGYSCGGTVHNMVNHGETVYFDTNTSNTVGDVIGTNNQSVTENCLSAIESEDIYTDKFDSVGDALKNLNNGNCGFWTTDGNNQLALLEHELDMHITVGNIVDFGTDYINVSWYCGGDNLSECKLQWRKLGEKAWQEIVGGNNSVNQMTLTGLTPKTIYEIRAVGCAKSGEILESQIDSVATLFAASINDEADCIIEDFDDLLAFSMMVAHGETFDGKRIALMHDIDMKGSKGHLWEPIRSKYSNDSFQGEFDGMGHVIYDMKIKTRKCHAGLFAITNGYIHDLTIRNSEIVCRPAACICDSKFPFAGRYGGVGGVVGDYCVDFYIRPNTIYPIHVERCGFEGTINGGNSIGGVVGSAGRVTKDSYAHGILQASKDTYRISGISCNEVQNCYFAGQIISDNTLEWVGGVSAGVYGVDNSYYNKNALDGILANRIVRRGYPIESNKMKEEDFIVRLNPSNPEIWTLINSTNDGYPVLAACNKPRVTTEGAICEEDGQVTLRALAFEGGNGDYVEKGFQYFSNTTNQQVVYDVKAAKEAGIMFETHLENKDVPSIGINYRAYAVFANNDTISGDWEEFVPNVVLPRLDLIAVNYAEGKGHVSYTIEVGTENVAKFDLVTVTDKDERFVQDLDYKETRGTISLPSYDDFPLTTFIECTLSNGRTIVSDSIAWGPFGIEGDANVDFRLTVADVTTTLNYILDIYPRHFSKENTDVNKDGNITVTDATIITNMVMGATYKVLSNYGDNTDGVQSNLTLQMDDLSFANGVPTELGIRINEAENFVAAQFDIIVDDCIKIVDAIADSKHDVVWKHIYDNRYRIMVYSMVNEHFATDNIVYLTFVADSGAKAGSIGFDNVFVDSVNGNEINEIKLKPSDVNYTTINATGLEQLGGEKSQSDVYYNLKGQRILTPHKGGYIVNGKKVTL